MAMAAKFGVGQSEYTIEQVPRGRGPFGELLLLYGAAFAEPPWRVRAEEVEQRRPILLRHLSQPGAELVVVRSSGRLVAAAYGWPGHPALPPEDLYRRVSAAVPAPLHHRLVGEVFEIAELMVHPEHRRRGLGRMLLNAVRRERSAWLLTHPDGPAVGLYDSDGWLLAGRLLTAGGHPLSVHLRDGGA